MTVYCIWEAHDATGNKARLLFNDEIDVLSFNVEDCGHNYLTIVSEKDVGRLAHHIAAFFMDRSLKAEAEKEVKE